MIWLNIICSRLREEPVNTVFTFFLRTSSVVRSSGDQFLKLGLGQVLDFIERDQHLAFGCGDHGIDQLGQALQRRLAARAFALNSASALTLPIRPGVELDTGFLERAKQAILQLFAEGTRLGGVGQRQQQRGQRIGAVLPHAAIHGAVAGRLGPCQAANLPARTRFCPCRRGANKTIDEISPAPSVSR
ncbi:hypothetical protein LP420_18820 [Massilia sp. B-10]|nr:hypothetical protein LP420_18820 [Massilia sp. B-10]